MLERKIQNQTIRKVKDKMAKKDYIKIAATLKESKPVYDMDENTAYALLKAWNITCENFAYMLAKDNPFFNRTKFLQACGYTD